MLELKLLDNNSPMLDSGSDGDQSDDKAPNVKNMIDQPRIEGIPEGDPSAIKNGSSNSDEDMAGTHHSKINQDDVNLLSSLLEIPRDDRKIQYYADQEKRGDLNIQGLFPQSQRRPNIVRITQEKLINLAANRRTAHNTGVESEEIETNNHYCTKNKST